MKITRHTSIFRLKNKVVLNIVIAAIVLELISALQFYHTQQLLADELEIKAESELTMKAIIIKSALNLSENSLMGHLGDMERSLNEPDSLFTIMEGVLKAHPNLTGCWIAFIPNYYPQKGRLFEPYAYWDHGEIGKSIIGPTHNYTESSDFKRVISTNDDVWLDPYIDNVTHLHMVSYAVPIHDKNKKVVAVFGLDVPTKMLGDTLNNKHIYKSSFNLLLTKEGMLVAGPDSTHKRHTDAKFIANLVNDSTIDKRDSKNKQCKIVTFNDPEYHEKGYVYYTSFDGKPDWQIAVVCYDDEVFGPLRQMYLTIFLTTLAGLIVLGFIIHYFIKNNTKLKITKREKDRIDSELHIASNIQLQMLPTDMPADRDDIDIYGSLLPAREVGGDLFDYFIRDEKLFFCIGDVSGKGVPAAMLMAVTHTWFRAVSTHQHNPAHIMQVINEASCERNESNMFVTLFIGILDLPTGHFCYCNAGHDAPVIVGKEPLPVKPNLPIGLFDDFTYEMQDTMLENGSMVFLYTDGLTEAKDKKRKLFGEKRMMTLLNSSTDLTPRLLLGKMNSEVHAFTDGAEQSDDLTMLAIRYMPKKFDSIFSETLALKNDVHDVPKLNNFMKLVAANLKIEQSLARQLRLAVEEAVVNVIDYAYPLGTEGDITIKVMSDGHRLKIQIIDSGVAFDPTAKEKADVSLPAEERQIGGLGILLVRELMNTINYERLNGQNILTLVKILPETSK